MLITIDSAGRLVVPKVIRKEARLEPGIPLEITFRDGRIEIEPSPRKVNLVKQGSVKVAVPMEESEQLTVETIQEIQYTLRTGSR
ncbi:MAG: AbrB/MazE/SpoVT family DNA-binding domain-containing protein [Gammaproteobacteria bacterium]|nr:AbrB/MazE/SpoVT family DNA-binding domain-containing protein [Gammaproteobacteria bacterium]